MPLGERTLVLVRPRLLSIVESGPLYGNPPDPELTRLWRGVLRPGDLAVDVGANIGVYALLAAETGARVIAMEPSSGSAERLRQHVRLNGYEELVEVRETAAGAASGRSLLTVGTGVLNHIVERPADESPERLADKFRTHWPSSLEEVDVAALDDLIGSDRPVTAMKIDVEGQEENALRGAQRLLVGQQIGYLQVENNTTSQMHYGRPSTGVWQLLRDCGYDLYRLGRRGELVPEGPRPVAEDVLAVAPGGLAELRLIELGALER
jgi:FkbM family methyltransferase